MSNYQKFHFNTSEPGMSPEEMMLCQGLEKLLPLGGFIKETVESSIRGCLYESAAEVVEELGFYDQTVWKIAFYAMEQFDKRSEEDDVSFDEKERCFSVDMNRFAKWELRQNIIRGKQIQENGHFWQNMTLPAKLKRALNDLSPVQETILSMLYGMDGGKERQVTELAAMPEFKCTRFYIIKERNEAEAVIADATGNKESLYQLCQKQAKTDLPEREVS
jgi:hypothetical protein